MEAQRFPRAARLVRAAEFAALRGGKRLAGRHFHAELRFTEHDTARLGLAVSKRVSKRAIERNRLKRLARESFRRCRVELPTVDLVLVARPSAAGIGNTELLADLAELWQRVAALKLPEPAGTIPG